MKTNYILTLFFFVAAFHISAQTNTIDQNQTITLTSGYVNSMSATWNVVSTVTDKPLVINYTIGTEKNYDFLTIYSVDNAGTATKLLKISGNETGQLTTLIPTGKAKITFTTDGSACYASNPTMYSGLNISFSVDGNTAISSVNSYQSGYAILNGKMGIGAIPTQSLSVKGRVAVTTDGIESDEGYNGALTITRGQASGQYINLTRYGMYPWSIGTVYNTDKFAIGFGKMNDALFTDPFFMIDPHKGNSGTEGFIGIGTSNPQAKLDVNGEIRSTLNGGASNLRMLSGGYASMLRNDGVNTYLLFTNNNDINGGWNSLRPLMISNATGNVAFADAKVNIIHDNGYVGIGTSNPLAKLHIESGSNNSYSAILATSLNGQFNNKLVVSSSNLFDVNTETFRISHEFNDVSNRNNGYIGFNRGTDVGHGFLTFGSNGTERMRIDGSGNVGIGTLSPQSKLEVNGDITIPNGGRIGNWLTSAFQYDNKTMGHYSLGWFQESQNTAYGPSLWASAWGGMKFFTGGMPRLTVDFSGNVGIGTTNPQNALDVKGTIRATEVKVESVDKFADFVFEKQYKLPTLNEVHAYINENGHLKDIPSAQEVKENGMSLTEMNVKLLQKVEELTLYMIELQKQVEELKKAGK